MLVRKLCKRTLVAGTCLAMLAFAPALAAAEDGQDVNNNRASGTASATVNGNGVNAASVGASVQGGSENVAVGSSILVVNGQSSDVDLSSFGSLIVGGSGNTAIGINAQTVNGEDLKAVGYGAMAGYGNNNTAIGNQTFAGYGSFNSSIGTGASAGGGFDQHGNQVLSNQNVAVGYQAQAYGGNSVAVGAYSVANEPNTFSVGQPGYERRITNVAPGVYGTDAVNMSQLWDTNNKVNRLGATAMAMSALAPMGYNPKEPTQLSAGIGTYGGRQGFAIGVYHYTHENVMLNAAFGWSNDGWEKAGRLGITWLTGGGKKDNKVVDNTIYGSNVPGANPQAKAPSQPVSGNIKDRVNHIIGNGGSDSAIGPSSQDKTGDGLKSAKVNIETKAQQSDPQTSDNIVDRVNRLLAESATRK